MIVQRKRFIFLLLAPLLSTSYCRADSDTIDAKNMEYFGIRYLNHLEYAVPEHEAIEKSKQSIANPYADLINQHYEAPIYIKFITKDVGYGIFAAQDIKKGELIGEYTGIVKPVDFSKKKEDFDYAWGFPPPAKFVVDSKDAGNFTRFINHSNTPNVSMVYVLINNRWHLAYIANQDIKKDQQLLANYGKPYWQGRGIKPNDLK